MFILEFFFKKKMTHGTLTGHISFNFFIKMYAGHLKIGGMPSCGWPGGELAVLRLLDIMQIEGHSLLINLLPENERPHC